MQKLFKILYFIFLIVISSCSKEDYEESGFGTVKGRVVEEITFNPVPNAKISTNPNSSIVFTDSMGYFTLPNIKIGEYSFKPKKKIL